MTKTLLFGWCGCKGDDQKMGKCVLTFAMFTWKKNKCINVKNQKNRKILKL